MAVASTPTLLPLDRFARIAGIHPLHFNQIVVDGLAPVGTCADPLMQYSWQESDKTGREEVTQQIADVEARLTQYLNFSPRPTYYANKGIQYPRPRNPELRFGSSYGVDGLSRALDLGAGYVESGGREAKSLIEAAVTITYTDGDNDGYDETATVVTTTNLDVLSNIVTNSLDVGVYYPGQTANDVWEIRPVSTTIDLGAGTVTCVFRREQCVLPELMFQFAATGVDGLDDANFLEEVDVYHHWLDYTAPQVELRWESSPCVAVSSFSTQNGSMLIRNDRLGWASITPSHWDSVTQQYLLDCLNTCGQPDTVRAWFRAGYPTDLHGNMAGVWERAITYLVLAELDRPLCQCPTLATFTAHWAYDLALNTGEASRRISNRKLDNPLGTTRAALYAWDQILRYRLPDKIEAVAYGT